MSKNVQNKNYNNDFYKSYYDNEKENTSYLPPLIDTKINEASHKIDIEEESKQKNDLGQKEMNIYEQLSLIKSLWDDLGVTNNYSESFFKYMDNLRSEDKKIFYAKEIQTLKQLRDNLMKYAKEINNRNHSLEILKKLNEILTTLFMRKTTKLWEDLYKDIGNAIKSLRIHTVNVVNLFLKIKDEIHFGFSIGKFEKTMLNKAYFYDPDCLVKLKNDVAFLEDSPIKNYYETSEEEFDTFLLTISSVKTSSNKSLRVIPISEELLKSIRQSQFAIIQSFIYSDMTNKKNQRITKLMNKNYFKDEYNNQSNESQMNMSRRIKDSKDYNSLFVKTKPKTHKLKLKNRESYQSESNKGKSIKVERIEIPALSREEFLKKLHQYEKGNKEEESKDENKEKEEIQKLIEEKRSEKRKKNKEVKKGDLVSKSCQYNSEDLSVNEEDNEVETEKEKKEEISGYEEGSCREKSENIDEGNENEDKNEEICDKEMDTSEMKMEKDNFEEQEADNELEVNSDKESSSVDEQNSSNIIEENNGENKENNSAEADAQNEKEKEDEKHSQNNDIDQNGENDLVKEEEGNKQDNDSLKNEEKETSNIQNSIKDDAEKEDLKNSEAIKDEEMGNLDKEKDTSNTKPVLKNPEDEI